MNAKKSIFVLPFALITLFGFSKLEWLSHPYFWDEAWSYGHAIHYFAQQKLSLSPAALDPELSRGHPLMFYYSAAIWLNLTDNHLFYGHLFALIIAILSAILVWAMAFRLSGIWAAGFVLSALLVNQMFYALSSRLYPEMMVALFSLLALWLFYHWQNMGYTDPERPANTRFFAILTACWSTLALMTKESGVATLAALYTCLLWRHRGLSREFWRHAVVLGLPLLCTGLWFFWQYSIRGWWLWPEHTDMIERHLGKIASGFFTQLWTLIFNDGRVLLLLAATAAFIWQTIKRKQTIRPELLRFLALMWLFIAFYLLFTAANFQTERYLLVPLLAYVLTAVLWIWEVFAELPWVRTSFLMAYALLQLYFYQFPIRENESSTGYLAQMQTWQKGIRWCEMQNMQQKTMWSYFLMRYYMTDLYLGYLTEKKPFTLTKTPDQAQFLIFDSMESGSFIPALKGKYNFELHHTISNEKHQVWIFER